LILEDKEALFLLLVFGLSFGEAAGFSSFGFLSLFTKAKNSSLAFSG